MVHKASTDSGSACYDSLLRQADGWREVPLDDRARRALECLDEAALLATAQALVRAPSVYNPDVADGNERAAADLVAELLTTWDMPHVRRDVAPGRPNIVADLAGARSGPTLILEGHTDVVTAGDRAAWTFDPFGGDIRDGVLYGRGAVDMKGGLAAMLHAARAIQQAGCDFAGTLRLAIMADEEGLMLGARAFVADGYLRDATAAITCEPESDRICLAQKGALRLRARLTGRMAHGCMPEQGANPILAASEFIVACRQLEQAIQAEAPPHPLLGVFTLTPTVALAGERAQVNVIPSTAEVMLDVRTTAAHDHGDIVRHVTAYLAEAAAGVPGVTHALDVIDDRPATETAPDDPIVTALAAAHRAQTGAEPAFGGVPGTTDLTIFWAASRLPVVAYGPGDVTLAHQADERVPVTDIVRYARVYVDAALRYFELMERR